MKNITRINDRTYEIYFSYIEPLTMKRKRVRRRLEGSIQEAEALRDELKTLARKGLLEVSESPSKPLAQWEADYLKFRKGRIAYSTLETERLYLSSAIIPDVGEWFPEAIKAQDLDRLIGRWSLDLKPDGKPYSASSIKHRVKILRQLLKFVFKKIGKDTHMLLDMASEVPLGNQKRSGRALTPEEAGRFINAFREDFPQHYPLIFLLIATGQRWGSVTALRWSDIDLERGWITFATSHYRGVVREGNKSGKTVRLPLTPELAEVLKIQKELLQGHVNSSMGIVFPTDTPASESSTQGYREAASYRRPFWEVCKKLKLGKVTPHDLRRTFNSLQIEAGLDGTILRSITAHSSSAMTDHYYHGSRDAKEKALGNVIRLVQGSC